VSNLGQGDYRGIQIVVANIAGGITTGAVVSGGATLAGSLGSKFRVAANSGRISAFFKVLGERMMTPFLPGCQTGAICLPSFKKLTVEWEHIFSGHVVGGSRVAEGSSKTLFPSHMSERAIKRAVELAFGTGKKVGRQLDTLIIEGRAAGLNIRIYYNSATRTIETAFPIFD